VKVVDRHLNGLVLLAPRVHTDDRGSFYESYNKKTFQQLTGFGGDFVQENHSTSAKGVLRGIHYQLPHPQAKLVRCIEGEVWDVAVDLLRSSVTFKEWKGFNLSENNRRQLWIPAGFGHAFVALSDSAQVLYRTTEFWDPSSDRSIRWDDLDLAIDWPLQGRPIVSSKDAEAPGLDDVPLFV
jgi:dTDP-4-dehydrorhamnose 3,5-epimerase